MVVPLLLGALLNTIDQMHLWPIQALLEVLGAPVIDEVINEQTGEATQVRSFLNTGKNFSTYVFFSRSAC